MFFIINGHELDKRLNKKLTVLEKYKKGMLENISGFDNAILNWKIKEEKWSITQILFHIIKTERLVEISIKNKIKNKEAEKSDLSSVLMIFYCKIAFSSPLKFKAPDLLRNMPDSYPIEELIAKWETIRNELKESLENFPEDYFNSVVFIHPYFGKFNIFQSIDFLNYHIVRHKKQINKIIKVHSSK